MKTFYFFIMFMLVLCSCTAEETELSAFAEEVPFESEEILKEEPEEVPAKYKNFSYYNINFADENNAWLYDYYSGIANKELCGAMLAKYNFSTKKIEPAPLNPNAEGKTEYLFTGSEILSIKNGEIASSFIAKPKYGSFCQKTGTYIFSPENNIIKMMCPDFEEPKTIYEFPAKEHEFVANTAISPDGEKILLDICFYEAMSQRKVICISLEGEVLFEINTENFEGLYGMFWIFEDEFVLNVYNDDERKTVFKIFGEDGAEHRSIDFDFYVAEIKVPGKNYPYGIIHSKNPDAFFVLNYENGSFEEIYSAPEDSFIHGFDLSPSGKTLCWIENNHIKTITEVLP